MVAKGRSCLEEVKESREAGVGLVVLRVMSPENRGKREGQGIEPDTQAVLAIEVLHPLHGSIQVRGTAQESRLDLQRRRSKSVKAIKGGQDPALRFDVGKVLRCCQEQPRINAPHHRPQA